MAMASTCKLPHSLTVVNHKPSFKSQSPVVVATKVKACCFQLPENTTSKTTTALSVKRCLRCNMLYRDQDNSPTACSFHGHITGENGLFALAPPHQGIDGEWTDRSGVIVYKWNEKHDRPNTGPANWKKRWSCCSEYNENAPPCQRGCHVSYDDGFTLY